MASSPQEPPAERIRKRRRGRVRRRRSRLFLVALGCATLLFLRLCYPRRTGPLVNPLPLAYPYVSSPNQDGRPSDASIDCVVLHATVLPTVEATVDTFLNPQKRVSAHFIVGKEGRVVQMVRVERRAWHAGTSTLEGAPHVNDCSVGIEMVNLNDGHDPYPEAQIEAVAGILRFLRSRYAIPDARVVSHAAIALPPGRKSDPAGFDFAKLLALARTEPPR